MRPWLQLLVVGSSLRLLPRGSRRRQREFRSRKSLTGRFRSVAEKNASNPCSRCEVGRLFYRYGAETTIVLIIIILFMFIITSKGGVGTRVGHSVTRRTTNNDDDDDTRVGRVLCAGWRNSRVLLVVRARSLARSPGSGWRTAHASTNRGYAAYWSELGPIRPAISLTITNRRQGHTSPLSSAHNTRERNTLAQLPGVPFRTLNRGHSDAHRSIGIRAATLFTRRERVSRFSSYRFAKHSDCENRCIDRVFVGLLLVKEVGIGNRLDIAVLVGNNIDFKFDFQAKNYMYIFRCNRKAFFKYNFSVINVKLEITLKNNLKGKKMRDLIYKEY